MDWMQPGGRCVLSAVQNGDSSLAQNVASGFGLFSIKRFLTISGQLCVLVMLTGLIGIGDSICGHSPVGVALPGNSSAQTVDHALVVIVNRVIEGLMG